MTVFFENVVADRHCGAGQGDVGGIRDIDVNDSVVKIAAQVATHYLSQHRYTPFHQKLVQIKSAKVQVVSGLLYHLELEVQNSGCLKTVPLEECDTEPLDDFDICQVKVLSKPGHVLKVDSMYKCRPVYHK